MLEHLKLISHGENQKRHSKDKNLINLLPKDNSAKRKLLACDSEDNSKGTTYMVNFFDGDRHYTFRNTEAAIEWLIEYSRQYKKGVAVWFANFQYDMGNLFRESQEYLSFNIAGSRFITGKIYQERIYFRDILNVIPGASVKKLGDMINLPKLDQGDDFNNVYYCQRDTEIVFWSKLVYEKALKKLNIELKNTAASTGFSALLKQYKPLQYNNLNEKDHEFMHRGYYGGRTEVFNTAKQQGEIYSYDIISSYPAAMKEIPLVNTYSKYYTKKPDFSKNGMAEIIIDASLDIEIPYLPVKHDNKLIFAKGRIHGVYTYFEINRALELGYKISKIINAIEFSKTYPFTLAKFIDNVFERRKQAKKEKDTVMDYACKIIMNASYGKFALGNERTSLMPLDEMLKMGGDFSSEVFPNNQVIVKKKTKYSPATNYFTASMITAMGRDKLYNYLIKAKDDDRELLYCDTDSVFFAGSPYPDNILGSGLGNLELQHEISECQFILPKTYYIKFKTGETIYKCKGVKGNLAKEFFTKGYAESMQPLKYVETCRKNFFINNRNKKNKTNEKFLPFNLWVIKPKSLKSKYDKRIRMKHGKTKPITLNFDLKNNKYI